MCVFVFCSGSLHTVLPLMKTLPREYNGHRSPKIPINVSKHFPRSGKNKCIGKGNTVFYGCFFPHRFTQKRAHTRAHHLHIRHGKRGRRFWQKCVIRPEREFLSIWTEYFTLKDSVQYCTMCIYRHSRDTSFLQFLRNRISYEFI